MAAQVVRIPAGLFHDRDVFALQVLNGLHLCGLHVADLLHGGGDGRQAATLGRAQAPVAEHQLVVADHHRVNVQAHRAHQHGLHDAHRAHRFIQLGIGLGVVRLARVVRALMHIGQRDLHDHVRCAALHGLVGVPLAVFRQALLGAGRVERWG